MLVDGEAGTAQGPEGAEDVEAEEEGEEADDGETEVGVGHYAGQVASVPVDQTGPLRVSYEVRGVADASSRHPYISY